MRNRDREDGSSNRHSLQAPKRYQVRYACKHSDGAAELRDVRRHRNENRMTKDPHFTALENMYRVAPINEFYRPSIVVTDSEASIELAVRKDLFHSFGAVHGSVYFKMLDDAAFFAANSLERDMVVVTTSFTTYLTRPVSSGIIRSTAHVVNRNKSQFIAEAVLYDSQDKELGRGSGVFVRSKVRLADARGYAG